MTQARPPSLRAPLKTKLVTGILLVLVATWIFATIAADVMAGAAITNVDVQLAHWFHSNATVPLTRLVIFFTHVHSTPGLLVLSAVFAVFLIRKRERFWLLTLTVAVPGGMLLNVALKHAFQRARPVFEEPLLSLGTYSFPSGHAAGSTVFYGMLAAYLICNLRLWRWRLLIAMSSVVLVSLVALSRMYLGVHYLSDVVAGIVESIGWLAFILTSVAFMRQWFQQD
jgi:membrane-associated phospholipid phosphatase